MPALLLLAAFAATRVLARLAFGLRFDSATLGYWQVLDVTLLRGDLLRSVLFLHGQPPLYNLFLGLVLSAVPADVASRAFEVVFLVTSYFGILGIHALLLELGAPRPAALAAAGLQTLSTTWLVYESWLFYTLPTAVLVTWSAVWFARAARGSAVAALAFAAAVVGLAWMRSTYHLAWVVAAVALLLVAIRGLARRVVVVAVGSSAAALAAVLALYAKNAFLFGAFTASTWLGMSLARMTTQPLDAETREEWIRAGVLDPVARVVPFSPLSEYAPGLQALPRSVPRHPALVQPLKSDGSVNLNHAAYVGIGRAYQHAALVVIRRRPEVYLRRVRRALRTWMRPPTEYVLVVPLREALRDWDRLHSRLLLWARGGGRREGPTWIVPAAGVLVLVALALRPRPARRNVLLLLAFPLLTVGWNVVVGNLVEVEENNRFRVEVEGLMAGLGSWGAIEVGRAIAQIARRPRAPSAR
jgi:hypothetical protein